MNILRLITNTQAPTTLTSKLSAECIQFAADTLIYLRASSSYIISLDPTIAIQRYCSLLESKSPFFLNKAAAALAQLAKNTETHPAIVSADAIPPLVSCLKSSDEKCRTFSAEILARLAKNTAYHTAIVSAGAIPLLVSCLESSDNKCKFSASNLLARFTQTPEYHTAIVTAGATPALVSCLTSPDDQCKDLAAYVLAQLARTAEHHTAIVTASAITFLVSYLESNHDRCKGNASALLARLANNTDNHSTIRCHLSKILASQHPNIHMPTDLRTDQIQSQKERMNTTLKELLTHFELELYQIFSNTKGLKLSLINHNNQASSQTPELPSDINTIIAQQLIEMADTAGVLQNKDSINESLKKISKNISHFYQVIALPSHSTETPTKSAAHSSEQENSSQIQTAFDELNQSIYTIGTFKCLESWQADTPEPVAQAVN